eukprot:5836718-Pyramimonas_sp.AAC.1
MLLPDGVHVIWNACKGSRREWCCVALAEVRCPLACLWLVSAPTDDLKVPVGLSLHCLPYGA